MNEKGPQEGATDANGHHICERLPRGSQPGAVADLVCEGLDLVQHLPDVWDHVRSICVYLLYNSGSHSQHKNSHIARNKPVSAHIPCMGHALRC